MYLGISLPAGHTGSFVGSEAVFQFADSVGEWRGTVLGSGSAIYDATAKRVTNSQDAFSAKAEVRGGTLRGSLFHADSDDSFSYKVESDREFPKKFSVRLPDFAVDGNAVTIPVVHFRYGRSMALCGCCGT